MISGAQAVQCADRTPPTRPGKGQDINVAAGRRSETTAPADYLPYTHLQEH